MFEYHQLQQMFPQLYLPRNLFAPSVRHSNVLGGLSRYKHSRFRASKSKAGIYLPEQTLKNRLHVELDMSQPVGPKAWWIPVMGG